MLVSTPLEQHATCWHAYPATPDRHPGFLTLDATVLPSIYDRWSPQMTGAEYLSNWDANMSWTHTKNTPAIQFVLVYTLHILTPSSSNLHVLSLAIINVKVVIDYFLLSRWWQSKTKYHMISFLQENLKKKYTPFFHFQENWKVIQVDWVGSRSQQDLHNICIDKIEKVGCNKMTTSSNQLCSEYRFKLYNVQLRFF